MLYYDVGGKIKCIAKVSFIVVTVLAILFGITIIAEDSDAVGTGLFTIFGVPVLALVSSWLLYGFGELIDTVNAIEVNTRDDSGKANKLVAKNPDSIAQHTKHCRKCGATQSKGTMFCNQCGAPF